MIDALEARRRLQALLEEQSTLVLSTAGERPWGAPLFYVPRDGALYWLSSPRSRHSVALTVQPQVAVAIHAPTFRWEEIRGAQMEGRAGVVVAPDERTLALAAYRARFALDAGFDDAIARSVLYRFVPARARLLDNGLGFPGRAEIVFGTPAGQAG